MNGKIATLVVLKGGNSEVANGIALNVCSNNPNYITDKEIPAEDIAKETEIEKQASLSDPSFAKKPVQIQEKIIEGRVHKNLCSSVLVDEEYVLDETKKVSDVLKENNASVIKTIRFAVGEGIEKRHDDFAAEVANQVK